MISRRKILACAAIGVIGSANQAFAKSSKPSAVERFDTDHDSTVDLAEAKKAATETFNKLDADKDGTLDLKELGGRVSRKELAAADHPIAGSLFRLMICRASQTTSDQHRACSEALVDSCGPKRCSGFFDKWPKCTSPYSPIVGR
jgi:hypothetical protein